MDKEQRNVRNLVRWIAAFVAWPALSLGLVFLLEPQEHIAHIVGLIPLGVAALLVFWKAESIAVRIQPAMD